MASATSVINSVFLWNILILVWIISHLPTRKPARFIGTGAQEHFWTLPSDSPSAAEQLMHHRVCLPIYIYALSLHTHVTVGLPYPGVYLLPSNNVLLSIPSPKGKCVKPNHHHPVAHHICGPMMIFLRLCFLPTPTQPNPAKWPWLSCLFHRAQIGWCDRFFQIMAIKSNTSNSQPIGFCCAFLI